MSDPISRTVDWLDELFNPIGPQDVAGALAAYDKANAAASAPKTKAATTAKTTPAKNMPDYNTEAINKLKAFLQGFITRLDFELATKTNPIDENGNVLDGKYEIAHVYITSGAHTKNKLTDIILHKLDGTTKAIKTADETPIENALRAYVAGLSTQTQAPATTTPATTPAQNLPASQDVTAVQQGTLTPYIRFGADNLVFARLDGRYLSLAEVGALSPSQIENHPLADGNTFIFSNGSTASAAYDKNRAAIAATNGQVAPTNTITPQIQSPAPAAANPQQTAAAPAAAKPLFVRYGGSPNIFNRNTGAWISPTDAQALGVFNAGAVQDISTPRPEVKTGGDFAVWNNRNLTIFPV